MGLKTNISIAALIVAGAGAVMLIGHRPAPEKITTAIDVKQPTTGESSTQVRLVCFDTQGHTIATRWMPFDKFDGKRQPLYMCESEPSTFIISSGGGGCMGGGMGGGRDRGIFISYDPIGHPQDGTPVWRRIYGGVECGNGISELDSVSVSQVDGNAMKIDFKGSIGIKVNFASAAGDASSNAPNLPASWVVQPGSRSPMTPPWLDIDGQGVPQWNKVAWTGDPIKRGLLPYIAEDFQQQFFKIGWSFEGCVEKGGMKGCVRGGS